MIGLEGDHGARRERRIPGLPYAHGGILSFRERSHVVGQAIDAIDKLRERSGGSRRLAKGRRDAQESGCGEQERDEENCKERLAFALPPPQSEAAGARHPRGGRNVIDHTPPPATRAVRARSALRGSHFVFELIAAKGEACQCIGMKLRREDKKIRRRFGSEATEPPD
jgi:hypothetical protein